MQKSRQAALLPRAPRVTQGDGAQSVSRKKNVTAHCGSTGTSFRKMWRIWRAPSAPSHAPRPPLALVLPDRVSTADNNAKPAERTSQTVVHLEPERVAELQHLDGRPKREGHQAVRGRRLSLWESRCRSQPGCTRGAALSSGDHISHNIGGMLNNCEPKLFWISR